MVKKITLNEEHLKLIPFIFIQEDGDYNVLIDNKHMFCLGSQLFQDMSIILGLRDKMIPKTENDADGMAFDEETEKHMLELYSYLKEHMYDIETLIHQFVVKGGISVGTYICQDNEMIWEKES